MAKFAKDTSLSGISSFVESMIDINGKIDEKYNIFVSQIGEASYNNFPDYSGVEKELSQKQTRVDEISKLSANEFENEALQEELKTLNKNRLESSKVYTKAKGATSAEGLSTKEKEAYTLLESSKYDLLKSLGLTQNDLKKLEIE